VIVKKGEYKLKKNLDKNFFTLVNPKIVYRNIFSPENFSFFFN